MSQVIQTQAKFCVMYNNGIIMVTFKQHVVAITHKQGLAKASQRAHGWMKKLKKDFSFFLLAQPAAHYNVTFIALPLNFSVTNHSVC